MYIMRDQHIFYLHSLYEVVFKQKKPVHIDFFAFLTRPENIIFKPKNLNFLDLLTDRHCVNFTDYRKYVRLYLDAWTVRTVVYKHFIWEPLL